jgi:hypothetical protein
MKPRIKLAWITALAFGLSFFLPALDKIPGLMCCLNCVFFLMASLSAVIMGDERWRFYLYPGMFTFTNALFLVLLVRSAFERHFSKTDIYVMLVLLTHVLSWPLVKLIGGQGGYMGLAHASIGLGYYVWVFAFVLQSVTCLIYRKRAEPVVASV